MPPALPLKLTVAVATACLLSGPAAWAQSDTSKAGLERAQKAADAVFHWIKLNGDKGASRQTPAPAPAPAPAPVARKAAPVAVAPRPAPSPAVPNAATPAPAPAAAAAQPEAGPALDALQVAAAAPAPAPAAPLAVAAQAAEPPPAPAGEAEVPLKLLRRVDPAIPPQLQRQALRDGFARVRFTVAPDGTVSRAESLNASHSRLAAVSLEAVRQWRFAPIPEARDAAVEFAFNNAEE